MFARLILIAQAETDASRRAAFPRDDEPLNERGIAAAERARVAVPRHDTALTGPGAAACATAALLGLDAMSVPVLRDLDVGPWAGAGAETLGDGLAPFLADPAFRGHGGESLDAFCARIGDWLAARRDVPGITVAVAPSLALRAALAATLGAAPPTIFAIDVAPLTALTLGSDGRRWTLRAFAPLPPGTPASDPSL